MTLNINTSHSGNYATQIFLFEDVSHLQGSTLNLTKEEVTYCEGLITAKKNFIHLVKEGKTIRLHFIDKKSEQNAQLEQCRKAGNVGYNDVSSYKEGSVLITSRLSNEDTFAYCEGFLLSSYQFNKYFTKKEDTFSLSEVSIPSLSTGEVKLLDVMLQSVQTTKDLVNEPVIYLTASQLSEEIKKVGALAGFEVEVLNKQKIEALKMGGLLGVNAGSVDPPTFNILTYKGEGATQENPIVLVGKGVVYDTGGLSLKPTAGSMDTMKCDMAGAATVVGIFQAVASLKLPIYLVGLIPATDNRPSGNAITPGDVITISDGTTIEVLNTDAEGRLILADALHYAKKYNPSVVFDYATLTGAAARAIGHQGIVYMGTANEEIKSTVEAIGHQVCERLVEFPLWDEYQEMLKSDIADMKNVTGGVSSGAITAVKFLQHFTNYPWLHFDIAGPAFLTFNDSYRGKNATAIGLRLTLHFLKQFSEGKITL
jgi:leucyl aminopeptidase